MSFCNITPENFDFFRPLLPKEVAASYEQNPNAYALGYYKKKQSAGIALYTINEELSMVRIPYIAVSLGSQNQGIAKSLLLSIAKNSYQEGYYTFAEFLSDGNDSLYGLFESAGMFTVEELMGGSYVFSKEDVSSTIKKFEKKYKNQGSNESFGLSECKEYTKKRLREQIREAGLAPEGIMEYADGELSAVVVGKGLEPTAQILVGRSIEPSGYEILFAGTDQKASVNDLIAILYEVFYDLRRLLKTGESLLFTTGASSFARLISAFAPEGCRKRKLFRAGYNGESVI